MLSTWHIPNVCHCTFLKPWWSSGAWGQTLCERGVQFCRHRRCGTSRASSEPRTVKINGRFECRKWHCAWSCSSYSWDAFLILENWIEILLDNFQWPVWKFCPKIWARSCVGADAESHPSSFRNHCASGQHDPSWISRQGVLEECVILWQYIVSTTSRLVG